MTIAEKGRLKRGETLLLQKISSERLSDMGKDREAKKRVEMLCGVIDASYVPSSAFQPSPAFIGYLDALKEAEETKKKPKVLNK